MKNDCHISGELLATNLQYYFKGLMLEYQHQLYTFALRLMGHDQEAEDVVQEAFIGAYIQLRKYSQERIRQLQLRPWLYKITANTVYSRKRDLRMQMTSLDDSQTADSILFALPSSRIVLPEKLYERTEQLRELELAVMALPGHYRVVISCYYFEELSYQEIADILDLSMGTVKSRLYRGLRLLRQSVHLLEENSHGKQ